MDLLGAISKVKNEFLKKSLKEKDKELKKKFEKEYKELQSLFDEVAIKEEYRRFTTEYRTSYTAEYFEGKKIMSDDKYNQLKKEWSKRVGENLLSFNEEVLRIEIESIQGIDSGLSQKEKDEQIEALKDLYNRKFAASKDKNNFEKSRNEFYSMIQKMPRKKREKLLKDMMSSNVTIFDYKDKLTLGKDEE